MGKKDLNTLHVDEHFCEGRKNLLTFGRGLRGTSVTVKRGRLTVEIIISGGHLFVIRLEKKNKTVDKSSVNIHLTSLSDKLFIYKSLSFKAENITSHTTCGV